MILPIPHQRMVMKVFRQRFIVGHSAHNLQEGFRQKGTVLAF
jgi:hypothetical protein